MVQQFEKLQSQSLNHLFISEPKRTNEFYLEAAGITCNYAYQPINKEVLFLLTQLAERYHLQHQIDRLFSGKLVNHSEQKPALHTALRSYQHEVIVVNRENINLKIHETIKRMESIAHQIRNQSWYGFMGTPITDIVNIGIGGSDLGPKMAVCALKQYKIHSIRCHFISDSDPDNFDDVVNELNSATTLFIVASKSFTTQETLLNLKKAIAWMGLNNSIKQHFIAVTANTENPKKFGIEHILPIWDWVGGRYSFFSAINLILMIAIGPEHFQKLLSGARAMDTHFKTAPFARNMPVLLALLGIWNLNFLCANNHLLLVYSNRLNHFISYLQQLDMESNGKSRNIAGEVINYTTGPIIWGGLGNHAEHAFYQLLFEGSHYTPGDCIFIGEKRYESMNQAAFKKIDALAFGVDTHDMPHLLYGKSGINNITLTKLDPYTLGSLIALYEHKIFTQSVLWHINAFDQPGVEAVKRFTKTLCSNHSRSTASS
ncbi:MAG: hypothetical protein A3F18_04125 [Legionellales bacterium RIFCSPHIGHO2_12_FULL_37_14]|nr:MAG: hypothetical protein A3F18_04125 [Legionellales bacterium RIFCSPHIGHO2_12_FULL_37_14]